MKSILLLMATFAGCAHGHYEVLPLADPSACAAGGLAALADQAACDKRKPDPVECAVGVAKAVGDVRPCVPPMIWIPDPVAGTSKIVPVTPAPLAPAKDTSELK